MEGYQHAAVLAVELLEFLAPQSGGVYVDANLGGGSHALKILEKLQGGGQVVGLDLDPTALQATRHRLQGYSNFQAVHGNFADLRRILDELKMPTVQGVIFDLGVSSPQLDQAERGFSFRGSGPLDMRFNPQQPVTAARLLSEVSEQELSKILWEYGEERWAAKIARAVIAERSHRPFTTTDQLATLVERTIPRKFHPPRTHAATRTFQALRIAVNDELENLRRGLRAAIDALAPHGRICCIAYHSLEDRIVKQTFLRCSGADLDSPSGLPRGLPQPTTAPPPLLRILTRQPIRPSSQEVSTNPRARSASLRAAEKLEGPS